MNIISQCTLITASFNNAWLTRTMLLSLLKKIYLSHITIIDNGSCDFFVPNITEQKIGIRVIDNHNYKLTKNWGIGQVSKNHCHSLNYALNTVNTEWAIICDNDILFKPTIGNLIKELKTTTADIVGEIGYDSVKPARIFPYLCAIRIKSMRDANVSYFDPLRCMIPGLDENGEKCNLYDTGYSFYVDSLKAGLKIKPIHLDDYCVHYLHASQKSNKIRIPLVEWIDQHKLLL